MNVEEGEGEREREGVCFFVWFYGVLLGVVNGWCGCLVLLCLYGYVDVLICIYLVFWFAPFGVWWILNNEEKGFGGSFHAKVESTTIMDTDKGGILLYLLYASHLYRIVVPDPEFLERESV